MIFVFLVDTSVSMEQELSSGAAQSSSTKKTDENVPEESIFGGQKGGVNRRWQRKGAGPNSATAGLHKNTRLDCAKSIVEQIITNRQGFDQDRYMLVTYNGGPNGCIRSNIKDSRATLISELRKLEAKDKFYGGVALTTMFNQLSLMRGAYDLDTYGYGRYPTLSDPVHIVWLTDGASVVTATGIHNKLNLPVNNTPWVEAYVEPFRWDQQLSLVLLHEQSDDQLCVGKLYSSESTLLPMCSVMGGATHHVGSMHQAQRFVESFAPSRSTPGSPRTQGSVAASPGVLVNFERIDDNPANFGNSDLRVLLHATPCHVASSGLPPPTDGPGQLPASNGPPRNAGAVNYGNSAGVSALINGQLGYFPIPEAFWPEVISPPRAQGPGSGVSGSLQAQHAHPSSGGNGNAGNGSWQIPRRSAHPTLGYSQTSTEWTVPPQFPFDKYQIDTHCNVAQKLLAAAQAAQAAHEAQGGKGPSKPVCWPVFVNGSYTTPKNSGFPFGILRANTARTAVNLYVLPYNFTALWKILGKLDAQAQGQHSSRAAIAMSPGWQREFEEYLQHTPGYYAIPLKRAFNLYGIPHGVFPKTFGQSSGMRNIIHYSLRLHNLSRKEWDRLHPGSGIESGAGSAGSKAALDAATNLQQALLSFTPASDASHLVANAFDVDRAHCLATLSAMRRVFVRECMSAQSTYFRANAVVPPSITSMPERCLSGHDAQIDAAEDEIPRSPSPYTPPVASMEYSLYGFSQAQDGSGLSSPTLSGSAPSWLKPVSSLRQQGTEMQQLEPGAEFSPLGGLVDVASEDDRDSRHSVPIRNMGVFGAAMHRLKQQEARDPLQDERVAMQQRRNMFGNPYRRPTREPRGPANNVLARNPELSAKLGLSRAAPKTTGATAGSSNVGSNGIGAGASGSAIGGGNGSPQPRVESDDDAAVGLEMEGEAEVNEFAIDKMIEDMPMGSEEASGEGQGAGTGAGESRGRNTGGRFWWMQRRDVPRRRSINAPWRKNDDSWNVNPWATRVAGGDASGDVVAEPGTVTYTADAVIVHKGGSQIVKASGNAGAQSLGAGPATAAPISTPAAGSRDGGTDCLSAKSQSPQPASDAEPQVQGQLTEEP
ncbi:Integrator complex subunit 6, partial [Coemansia sp. RSA 2599]